MTRTVCPETFIEPDSPPTSYAIAALLNGEKGALVKTLGNLLLRAFLIAPGLYLSGLRGEKIVTTSLLTSGTITIGLIGLYAVRRDKALRKPGSRSENFSYPNTVRQRRTLPQSARRSREFRRVNAA